MIAHLPEPFLSRAEANILKGYWRAVLRIHYGIPGLVGEVSEDRSTFTGGMKDLTIFWPLAGADTGTLPLIDSLRPAGEYHFGSDWRKILGKTSFKDMLNVMIQKFGMIPPHVIAGKDAPDWYKKRRPRRRGKNLSGLGQIGEGGITWKETLDFLSRAGFTIDGEYFFHFADSGINLEDSVWEPGIEIQIFFRGRDTHGLGAPAMAVQILRPEGVFEPIEGVHADPQRALEAVWWLTKWMYGMYTSVEELIENARGY